MPSSSLGKSERALHVHEVGTRLGQRTTTRAQDRRRMQRRDQYCSLTGTRERKLSTAQFRDAFLGLQQQLGREVAERDDDARPDELELAVEPRRARLDLVRLRIAIPGRTTLHDVRDVNVGPGEADTLDELGEQLSRPTDERLALQVLLLARTLAHEDQIRVGAADAEHDLRPSAGELAPRAGRRGGGA